MYLYGVVYVRTFSTSRAMRPTPPLHGRMLCKSSDRLRVPWDQIVFFNCLNLHHTSLDSGERQYK